MCKVALQSGHVTVHNLEKLLGTMESVRPCTPLAALNYSSLQGQLISEKRSGRRPNKIVTLTRKSLVNLQWWVSRTGFAGNCSSPVREPSPTLDIWSDANLTMGGARCSRGQFVQQSWGPTELATNPGDEQRETVHIELFVPPDVMETVLPAILQREFPDLQVEARGILFRTDDPEDLMIDLNENYEKQPEAVAVKQTPVEKDTEKDSLAHR
jgi:hypothetical protein